MIAFDVNTDGTFGPSRVEGYAPDGARCEYCWGPGSLQQCGSMHCEGCAPFMAQLQGCTCGDAK